mmetsp:Transcript_4437/g.11468  ORF Transcript_4437/g.11468 Transcript_4437/m.11468 type:complete len:208 (-) Transcript_4437:1174-1797(-)
MRRDPRYAAKDRASRRKNHRCDLSLFGAGDGFVVRSATASTEPLNGGDATAAASLLQIPLWDSGRSTKGVPETSPPWTRRGRIEAVSGLRRRKSVVVSRTSRATRGRIRCVPFVTADDHRFVERTISAGAFIGFGISRLCYSGYGSANRTVPLVRFFAFGFGDLGGSGSSSLPSMLASSCSSSSRCSSLSSSTSLIAACFFAFDDFL